MTVEVYSLSSVTPPGKTFAKEKAAARMLEAAALHGEIFCSARWAASALQWRCAAIHPCPHIH